MFVALLAAGCTVRAPAAPAHVGGAAPPAGDHKVLDEVAALPISTWSYKWQPTRRHLGPMAQDFHAAFGLGGDVHTYDPRDADALSLEALAELGRLADEQDRRIARLEAENRRLEQALAAVPARPRARLRNR